MKDPCTEARDKLLEVFDDAFRHDGFGEIRVEMRILKRRQKEVIIHFGKQYRFLVDYDNAPLGASAGADDRPARKPSGRTGRTDGAAGRRGTPAAGD